MKKIFIVISLIIISLSVFGQSGNNNIKYVNSGVNTALSSDGLNLKPSEVTAWLYDVSFSDSNNGTAVGSSGVILRTTNGGETWKQQLSRTTYYLYGVFFSDSGTGIVVGEDGLFTKTTDAGETWNLQSGGEKTRWVGVAFADKNYGIAISSDIVRTTNGGNTWTLQYRDNKALEDVCYMDKNNAIAVGGSVVGPGIILRTSDGGITWTSQTWGNVQILKGVCFTDKNHGVIVGSNGLILKTTDGGSTWKQQTSGTTNLLTAVSFNDVNNGLVAGEYGTILRTLDGGTTWTSQPSRTFNNLYGISFNGINSGTAVGIDGLILKTKDGGKTWFPQKGSTRLLYPRNNSFGVETSVQFSWQYVIIPDYVQFQLSKDSSFSIIYNDTILSNSNFNIDHLLENTNFYWRIRGNFNTFYGNWTDTWSFRTRGKIPGLFNPVNNSTISPKSISFQWSESEGATEYKLQISTDSLFQSNLIEKDTIKDTSFVTDLNYNTKYYWRVGAKNYDGQTYWSDQWTFYSRLAPETIFPLDIGNKWYYQGTIVNFDFSRGDPHEQKYGLIKQITDSLSNGFKRITARYYYRDSTITKFEYWGYIDGSFYVIDSSSYLINSYLPYIKQKYYDDYLAQTDTCTIINTTYDKQECRNFTNMQIFSEFQNGQIYDLFIFWIQLWYRNYEILLENIGIVKSVKSAYAKYAYNWKDTDELIGMSINGKLFGDTVFTVISGIDEKFNVPLNYALFQNYPNPFNPNTKIKYSIPQTSFVNLKIYDLLGREVTTLVNEEKPAGSYEAEFSGGGRNLSSGIYFYKIQAGNYSSVKKMILVK